MNDAVCRSGRLLHCCPPIVTPLWLYDFHLAVQAPDPFKGDVNRAGIATSTGRYGLSLIVSSPRSADLLAGVLGVVEGMTRGTTMNAAFRKLTKALR